MNGWERHGDLISSDWPLSQDPCDRIPFSLAESIGRTEGSMNGKSVGRLLTATLLGLALAAGGCSKEGCGGKAELKSSIPRCLWRRRNRP
jgi:hypothetical protein